jgi:hypothetical protein
MTSGVTCAQCRIFTLLLLCLFSTGSLFAQQYSLYNSRTLYDVFENPSQSAYQIDTSRRIAFNFFIPTLSFNGTFNGPAEPAIKSLIYDGVFNGRDINLSSNQFNTLAFNTNTYIAMLRVLRKVKRSEEVGISWQVRDDARIRVTNETFAIFDDYRLFLGTSFTDLFNDKGYNQSYHQFSLTYRRNETKRFAIGLKASLLSGISYTAFNVNQSDLTIDELNDKIHLSLAGRLRTSFKFDDFDVNSIIPTFKNPGLSVSGSASYKLRNGWFVMGNLKDLGFIRWGKNSYEYAVNTGVITIDTASNKTADDRISKAVEDKINESAPESRSYVSALNGKIEVLINKNYGSYQPNLILSKSLFYGGGNIVLTNNYHVKNYVFTLTGDYNTNNFLQVGAQAMIKTPNTEFFLGSDNILKTAAIIKNAGSRGYPYSAGYSGASFYLGFGFKFGRVLEHPANANNIPGFEDFGRDKEGGMIKKIFKKKKKAED